MNQLHPLYQILAKAAHKKSIKSHDFITVAVDFAFINDLYLQVILSFKEIGSDQKVWNTNKIAFIMDHYAPSPTIQAASNQKKMRDFVNEQKIPYLFDINKGVCHQVLPEAGLIRPGMILVGTDSHTTTHGAYGCFSTGIGATDMAGVLYTGEIWLKVPEIMRIKITGNKKEGVMAKDIMLFIISCLGTDCALYQAIDFTGDIIHRLSLDERLVLCNMSVEMGAKATYIAPDKKVFHYIQERSFNKNDSGTEFLFNHEMYSKLTDDAFSAVHKFNISDLAPQVALPHQVNKVVSIDKIEGEKIHQALIGTCTGGRLSDLEIAAKILKNRKIHSQTRLLVVPASDFILKESIKKGYLQVLLEAGATIVTPSCGPCLGAHEGILAPEETCISTSSRNFPGRMGSKEAKIFLSSPATVAASAIFGKITDPRKFLLN